MRVDIELCVLLPADGSGERSSAMDSEGEEEEEEGQVVIVCYVACVCVVCCVCCER